MPALASRPRLATLAVVIAAAAAAFPAAAQATGDTGCPDVPMTHPFLPWGDDAPYLLAPDGGLEEGGSAWTLEEGAAVAAGNETFQVGGPADRASLELPAGSSATTAPMCIGVEHRSMRFFVKRAGRPNTELKVEVLYASRAGKPRSATIGRIGAGTTWDASPIVPLVVNELAPERGNAMQVSLRFTPHGGDVSIDDVYVDPWRSR